jgi:hypothetical protein
VASDGSIEDSVGRRALAKDRSNEGVAVVFSAKDGTKQSSCL